MATEQTMSHHHEEEHHHVLPYSVYFLVYFALLVLTYLTVMVSYWDLGALSLPVAMLVALVKAAFVVGYFMHLKYDNAFLKLVFFGSVLFLVIFFTFTLFDLGTRGILVNEEGNFVLRKDVAAAKLEAAKTKPPASRSALAAAKKAAKNAYVPDSLQTKDYTLPASAPKFDDKLLALGKKQFETTCATCHGKDGQGNGPGAAAANPKPTNYAKGEYRHGGTPRDIFRVISFGAKGTLMAPWASVINTKARWALVHYITSTLDKTGKAKPRKKAPAARKAAKAPAPRRDAPAPRKAAKAPEKRQAAPAARRDAPAPRKDARAPEKRQAAPAARRDAPAPRRDAPAPTSRKAAPAPR